MACLACELLLTGELFEQRCEAVQERLKTLSVDPMPMTLAEFGEFFKNDVAANLALVEAAKIPKQ